MPKASDNKSKEISVTTQADLQQTTRNLLNGTEIESVVSVFDLLHHLLAGASRYILTLVDSSDHQVCDRGPQ